MALVHATPGARTFLSAPTWDSRVGAGCSVLNSDVATCCGQECPRSVDYLRAIYTDWPSIGVFNGDTDAWGAIWKELTEN